VTRGTQVPRTKKGRTIRLNNAAARPFGKSLFDPVRPRIWPWRVELALSRRKAGL